MPPGLKTLPWLIALQESQPFIGMDGMQEEREQQIITMVTKLFLCTKNEAKRSENDTLDPLRLQG